MSYTIKGESRIKINGKYAIEIKGARWKVSRDPKGEGNRVEFSGTREAGEIVRRVHEPTPEELERYNAWVASRPPRVRELAERFDPWTLYRLKTTGQRVYLISFDEPADEMGPVTLKVGVSGEYNLVAFERQVFGIKPEDLEPCNPPHPDELVGAPPEAVQEAIVDSLRHEVEE